MSESIWFEEVNVGLIKEIKNTVKIRNADGDLVSLPDNNIIIRKPEEDFKIEVFPCVSIYNITYKHSPIRYSQQPKVVSRDVDSKSITLQDSAVPFDLSYQIDFWSQYQTEMDCMTRTWLFKHFRQFNLAVVDEGGVETTCNSLMKGDVVKSDLLLNAKRLFHSIINLQIWVEIDSETGYNMPMVTVKNIDLKEV